jgi:hypothetical protein
MLGDLSRKLDLHSLIELSFTVIQTPGYWANFRQCCVPVGHMSPIPVSLNGFDISLARGPNRAGKSQGMIVQFGASRA